jgi:DNA polymerase III epsilon subunit-like protein
MRYVCIDLESTCGEKGLNSIIQISAVWADADGKRFGQSFDELVRSTRVISCHAQQVHGVTLEKLKGGRGDFRFQLEFGAALIRRGTQQLEDALGTPRT